MTHRLRVLIAEDNVDVGNTLCKLLQVKGHETQLARNGLEAVDLATEFQPQVILMDVEMPQLNGYEATERIRKLPGGEDIYVVALTGRTQGDDIERASAAGCSAHLSKPLDFPALDRLLASLAADRPSA